MGLYATLVTQCVLRVYLIRSVRGVCLAIHRVGRHVRTIVGTGSGMRTNSVMMEIQLAETDAALPA